MKDISKKLFEYFESNLDLKTRLIYNALSVNLTDGEVDVSEKYRGIFKYDEDDQFFSCINKNECSHIQSSHFHLDKIPRLKEVSNHPVHILNDEGNMNPSALIPFCRIGNIILGKKIDKFLTPVCTGFKPKVLADTLCYSLDLNDIGNNITIGNGKEYALTLLIDLNEEKSIGLSKKSLSYSEYDKPLAKKWEKGDSSGHHLSRDDISVHIDGFYPYSSKGGGPYEMSYVKQIETTSDFRTIGQDKTLCQFDETIVECSNRGLITGAVDECGCIPWDLRPHIIALNNQSYSACTPITAACFFTYLAEKKDAVKDSCLHHCHGLYVDVLNIKKANTKVVMRDKKAPEDMQYLQILKEYRKYKRNWRNISDFDSIFSNFTQVKYIRPLL